MTINRRGKQIGSIRRSVASASILFACAACSSSTAPGGRCTAVPSMAIQVDVRDSITGTAIADSASGTVATSSYQDSLHHTGTDSLLWGGDQLGTYAVTVHRPSYADWVKTGVVVSRTGSCGNVIPVQLNTLLVRAP